MNINDEKIKNLPKGQLLDVRELDEWKSGHLENAIHAPLMGLVMNVNDFVGDKDTTYYVYCLSGGRAGQAVNALLRSGYKAENIGGVMSYNGNLVK